MDSTSKLIKAPFLMVCTRCALELCNKCLKIDPLDKLPICHTRQSNRQVCQPCTKDFKCINIPLLRTLGLKSESKEMFNENIKNIHITLSNDDFIAFISKIANLLTLINSCGISEAPKNLIQIINKLFGIVVANDEDRNEKDDLKKNDLEYEFIPEIIRMIEDNQPGEWSKIFARFSSFYVLFQGCSKMYKIFDYDDDKIWCSKLPYSHIIVFNSPLHAIAALRAYPEYFIDLSTPLDSLSSLNPKGTIQLLDYMMIQFILCAQCNQYLPRFPTQRRSKVENDICYPNFYSESLCRNPVPGHIIRYKYTSKS